MPIVKIAIKFVQVFAALLAGSTANAQESSGAKSIRAGEREGFSQVSTYFQECDYISHNLRFCIDGTDWALERERIHGEQSLYQLSPNHRAAFVVVPMPEGQSHELTETEILKLLDQKIFENGPRGALEIVNMVEIELFSNGKLRNQRAYVEDNSGNLYLHQVSISQLDYGLGFLETTIELPKRNNALTVPETALNFHSDFLGLTKVKVKLGFLLR